MFERDRADFLLDQTVLSRETCKSQKTFGGKVGVLSRPLPGPVLDGAQACQGLELLKVADEEHHRAREDGQQRGWQLSECLLLCAWTLLGEPLGC